MAQLKHLTPLCIYSPVSPSPWVMQMSIILIPAAQASVHPPHKIQDTLRIQMIQLLRGTGAGPKTSLIKLDGKSNLLLKMASSSS